MDYIDYYKRLDYLLERIQKSNGFSLSQLAQMFSCSERTVKRMIANLRRMGHPVIYHRKEKKYLMGED